MTAGSPLACRLDALTPEQRERRRALGARLRPRAAEVRELDEGYGLRLPADPSTMAEAAEFASLERLCCPFFRFVLELEPEAGPAWLRVTGPQGAKEFLRAALGM